MSILGAPGLGTTKCLGNKVVANSSTLHSRWLAAKASVKPRCQGLPSAFSLTREAAPERWSRGRSTSPLKQVDGPVAESIRVKYAISQDFVLGRNNATQDISLHVRHAK